MHLLNSFVKMDVRTMLAIFSNFGGISSGLGAELVLIVMTSYSFFCKCVETSLYIHMS